MIKPVVIFGSARSHGNTRWLIDRVLPESFCELIDLNHYHIQEYDYDYQNQEDDFQPLIQRVLMYERIIFATPIYWYASSTRIKLFLDRLTDLLSFHKGQGRQLRGKTMHLLATYGEPEHGKAGFKETFERIAAYLGMSFGQSLIYLMECEGQEKQLLERDLDTFKSFFNPGSQ